MRGTGIVFAAIVLSVVLYIGGRDATSASRTTTDATLEDWQDERLGAHGVPKGWLELPLFQRVIIRRGTLEIVDDEGQRALRLTTDATQHTIIRKPITIDLQATPVLEWRWKVVTPPIGADLREPSRSDSPGVLALAWRAPARVVAYAWDVTAPIGSRFTNPKQRRVNYIVVRSGSADCGRWVTERRDILNDYHTVFGEAPASNPEEIEISVDSNDTRSHAETLFGGIRATSR